MALSAPTSTEEHAHHQLAAQLAGIEIPEFVAPAHLHRVVDGLRLHCLDWGMASRPPVLFLHGGSQTARTWDLACLALREEFHCLALDQRGHGDSEWSYALDYSPESHTRDCVGLLDALQIERAVVVGMSMGCINGMQLAASHPDRVAALVAVDAGPWVRTEGMRPIREFVEDADGAETLDALVEKALRFNPRRDRRLLAVSLRHNLRALPDGRLHWKTDRRLAVGLPTMMKWLEDLRARVGDIRCPTLILRGAESKVFFDEDAARFADALPRARWARIEGAGHSIQGDAPAAMVREIRSFLARLP